MNRIGVIGAGIYGTHVLDVLRSASSPSDFELVAVSDINPRALEQARTKYGIKGYGDYREMIEEEDLDGVAVVTPDYLHRDISVYAAEKGVHVLCQKPVATTEKEGREMIRAAEKNNVILYVDYHKRFDPAHMGLKDAIGRGKLGEILYGDVYMEDRIEVPSVWFKNWAHNSSPAWFLGTHFYDLVYWMIESKPREVYAHGTKKKLVEMGIDTYDCVCAQVVFENDAVFNFNTSWILPENFTSIVNQKIRVIGTEGICEIDSRNRGVMESYSRDEHTKVLNPFAKYISDDTVSGYTCDSIIHFTKILSLIKSGEDPDELKGKYPHGEQALMATVICEGVHKSMEEGRVVKF